MRCALQIYTGKNAGRNIWIGEGQILRIGRTDHADFALMDDPHVSSVHFSVECSGGKAILRDLNSRNGTYINGNRIGGAALEHGDVIIAGKTHFQVSLERHSEAKSANAPSPAAGNDSPDIWATQPTVVPPVPSRSLEFDYEATESFSPEHFPGMTMPGTPQPPQQANPAESAGPEAKGPPAIEPPAVLPNPLDSNPTDPNSSGPNTAQPAPEKPKAGWGKSSSDSATPNYPRLSSKSFLAVRRHAGLGSVHGEKSPAKPADVGKPSSPVEPPAATTGPTAGHVFPPSPAGIPPLGPPAPSSGDLPPLRYEIHEAPSGMTYFCSRQPSRPPVQVADFIGQGRYLYAVVNIAKLPSEEQAVFFRDAISAGGIQISGSQLIIEKRDSLSFGAVLQRTWGSDATIFLATRQRQAEFVSQAYRLAEHLNSPATLLQRLYSDQSEQLKNQFAAISAILLETDQGTRWIVFKNDTEIRTWRTLGFPCPPELVG
ncbi:MAG: FHA domain-containing protein [Pirellulaceae bacterium]